MVRLTRLMVSILISASPAYIHNRSYADEIFSSVSDHRASSTTAALRSLLETIHPAGEIRFKQQFATLQSFYRDRGFEPAWTGSPEAIEAAARVVAAMADADKLGLNSAEYALLKPGAQGDIAPGMDAAIYDVSLTDALLRYATDLRTGRVRPEAVYKDVAFPTANFDASAAIELALQQHSIDSLLERLTPDHPEYRRLAAALTRYRNIASRGGWPAMSGEVDSDRAKSAIYSRLALEDSGLSAAGRPADAQLHEAIKRYQVRNGFAPDGVLRPDVISRLNVPVDDRIQQILANLERWRWIRNGFESRYITINVPDQTLELVQDGRVILTSRVIVGRKSSPTPILRTVANSLVANPPWDIPGDIAANQLLPHLKNNRNYLVAHNMVIVNEPGDPHGWNIAWAQVSPRDFPYAIRQLPPNSALGVLMLDSPNPFDVYLHDTPGKRFFHDDDREISNGCVRVEQIMPLASLALTGNPSAGRARLESAISSHQTRRIMLDDPLPIYMLYWTAIADADGNVGFRPDRYNRDPSLIEALNKRPHLASTNSPE